MTRHKAPDPESFCDVTEVVCTDQEAYYTSWLESCLVCGASGDPAKFLYCMECGEGYHGYCVQAPIGVMGDYSRLTWRCANCKVCEICGEIKPTMEEESKDMIYCEMCDKGHHMSCLDPPLTEVRRCKRGCWYWGW